jgi:hypothetical protein
MGTQFLRPIETAVLDGDNRILDFDVDTGAMDFSFVNNYVAANARTPVACMLSRVTRSLACESRYSRSATPEWLWSRPSNRPIYP